MKKNFNISCTIQAIFCILEKYCNIAPSNTKIMYWIYKCQMNLKKFFEFMTDSKSFKNFFIKWQVLRSYFFKCFANLSYRIIRAVLVALALLGKRVSHLQVKNKFQS